MLLLVCCAGVACKKEAPPPEPPRAAKAVAPALQEPAAHDAVVAWWVQARTGDPREHTAYPFDAELRVDAADACPNGGNLWAKAAGELASGLGCLKATITATELPGEWHDGWDCAHFSASSNALRLRSEHEGRREKLRCGVNAKGTGVFLAFNDAGVTAVLLSND